MRDQNPATKAQRGHLGCALIDSAARSMMLTEEEAQAGINCGSIMNWVAGSLDDELSALLRPGHVSLIVPSLPQEAVKVELGDRMPFRWDEGELTVKKQAKRLMAWLQPVLRLLCGRKITFSTKVIPYVGSNERGWPKLVLPDLSALTSLPISADLYDQSTAGTSAYGLLAVHSYAAAKEAGVSELLWDSYRQSWCAPVPAVAERWTGLFPRPYPDERVEVMFRECRFHPAVTFRVGDGAPHILPPDGIRDAAAALNLIPGGILALTAAFVAWPGLAQRTWSNMLDICLAGDQIHGDMRHRGVWGTPYLINDGGKRVLYGSGRPDTEGRSGAFLIDPGRVS